MASGSKIAVIGAGGVGGFVSAMLASHLPDVTVVARGDRGKTIEERGLILHSDYKGEITAHPVVVSSVPDLEDQDVVFICVKNYSLEQVLDELKHGRDGKPVVRDGTVLVPVMNGISAGENLRKAVSCGIVCDSVIYTVSGAQKDFSIRQTGNFTNVFIGSMEADPAAADAARQVTRSRHVPMILPVHR